MSIYVNDNGEQLIYWEPLGDDLWLKEIARKKHPGAEIRLATDDEVKRLPMADLSKG